MGAADQSPPLTVAEAARQLGLSERRVLQLIDSGALPTGRFGRSYAIAPAALERVRHRPPRGRPRKRPA